jgi:hypothetical protein
MAPAPAHFVAADLHITFQRSIIPYCRRTRVENRRSFLCCAAKSAGLNLGNATAAAAADGKKWVAIRTRVAINIDAMQGAIVTHHRATH